MCTAWSIKVDLNNNIANPLECFIKHWCICSSECNMWGISEVLNCASRQSFKSHFPHPNLAFFSVWSGEGRVLHMSSMSRYETGTVAQLVCAVQPGQFPGFLRNGKYNLPKRHPSALADCQVFWARCHALCCPNSFSPRSEFHMTQYWQCRYFE